MTRLGFGRTRLLVYLAAALVAAAGTFWPTPYSLLLPGTALPLDKVVSVPGHPSPGVHLYLTDVSLVVNAAPFTLIDAFFPGVRLLKTGDVIPTNVSADRYESSMRDAMAESQSVSTYVAERAAGYAIAPVRTQVVVGGLVATSHAALRSGDVLLRVDGTPIRSIAGLRGALARVRPGAVARIGYLRDGKREETAVATISLDGKAKLGVYIGELQKIPPPPVPVTFSIRDVSGSSGGLMFALQIYRTLRPSSAHADERIAGTGTLESDGTVGEIAGTMQKLVAARRAGATVFLVPLKNYDEVKDQHDMRVIPIGTFADAVKALAS